MARNDPQVNLRIPSDLKGRLDDAATNSNRSLTAEIVSRLTESFGRDEEGRVVLRLPEELLYRIAVAEDAENVDLRAVDFGSLIERSLERTYPEFTFDRYLNRIVKRIHEAPEGEKDSLLQEANGFISKRWPTLKVGLTPSSAGRTQVYIETITEEAK